MNKGLMATMNNRNYAGIAKFVLNRKFWLI